MFRWVGRLIPENLKVGIVSSLVIKDGACKRCGYSVKGMGLNQPDPSLECCRACIRARYETLFHKKCESV